MPNRNYRKGYLKELRIVNNARAEGCIALRSAGSHSPIDVVIIDSKRRIIKLVQSKAGNFSMTEKARLLKQMSHLNGNYTARFYVA